MLNIFRALLALANCLFFVGAIHAQAISQGIPNSVNPDAYPGDPIGFVNAVLGKPADQHVSQISTWKLGDAETIARHHISVLNRMNEITSAFKSWCSANKGVQTLTKGIPWHDPCLAENGSPVALFTVGFDSTMFVQVETQNIAVTRYNERTRVLQKLLEKAKDEKLGIPVLYFQRTGVIPRYAFGKWVAKGIQTMETNKDVPMLSGLIPVFYIPRLFVSSERFIPLLTDYSVETKPSDDRYFTYIRYKPLPAMFAGDGASNGWIVGCVPGKLDKANCYNFVRVSEYRLSFNDNKPGLRATSNGISGNILFSAQGTRGDGLKIISAEEYLAMESKDAVIEAELALQTPKSVAGSNNADEISTCEVSMGYLEGNRAFYIIAHNNLTCKTGAPLFFGFYKAIPYLTSQLCDISKPINRSNTYNPGDSTFDKIQCAFSGRILEPSRTLWGQPLLFGKMEGKEIVPIEAR